MNQVELWILIFFFVLVTGMGLVAARWKRAASLNNLDEWGLGGRNFGTWVSWFLLGGDLYTAYTFIAVPALIYGVGAAGFFAVPYTIIVYPMVFLVAPPLVAGLAPQRLRDAGGLRAGAQRLGRTGVGDRDHRDRRHDALHRAPARGHRGGDRRDRHQGQLAALHRLRGARRLHLLLRAAGAGADRLRQGHPDLHRRHRGDHLHPVEARRLGQHLREIRCQVRRLRDPQRRVDTRVRSDAGV